MRLSKIKLAGFKSFVDPTTIPFPSNRIGIVGPNGCGKSNVIDAVRWVMGEASAKHLRGDSMADVIFNGSTGRKPVGRAAVELVFDNADGRAGGQYANYAEIAIRREVSRDGTSSYFLNGTRCRRRDITDIFLGTGLGPRSYAIIEQGMIARIIESKPEELRVFFEEAAGISKYKERRRETETRIRHTRENIDRLNDLRDEIDKNLEVLKRQARSAERYKEMAAQARQLKAELLALKHREMDASMADKDHQITERENAVESAVAELRHVESSIEKQRAEHTTAQDAFNDVQGRFYSVGAEIARLEQAITHARELRQRQDKDLAQTEHQHNELENHAKRDQEQIEELGRVLGELEPALTRANEAQQASGNQLTSAEEAMQEWQSRWDAFTRQASESSQSAQVERTRIDHLDSQLQQALNRLEKLRTERETLSGQTLNQEISELENQAENAVQARDKAQRDLEQALSAIAEQREQDKTGNAELHDKRSALENSRGRLASLEALQQAALGKSRNAVNAWLADNRLADLPRLAEQLQVEEGWERAVETVLGFYLQAVCVEELDNTASALAGLEQGAVALLETTAAKSTSTEYKATDLAARISSNVPLNSLLAGVKTAANLKEAMAQRHTLAAGESFITPDGVWLGTNWLRVNREEDENAGVLAREQEIRTLNETIKTLEADVDQLRQKQEAGRSKLKDLEAQREELQAQANRTHRQQADCNAQLDTRRSRLEQHNQRLETLNREVLELEAQIEQGEAKSREARGRLEDAVTRLGSDEDQRSSLNEERDELRNTLEQARETSRTDREAAHEMAVKMEGRRSQHEALQASLERTGIQLEQLATRRADLRSRLTEGEAPLADNQRQLQQELEHRGSVEHELSDARKKLETLDAGLREQEQLRTQCEHRVEEVRGELEKLRLGTQEMRVRRQTLVEQLQEMDFELPALFEALPEEAELATWQDNLQQLEQRIARLGNINMAAIDQYQEQSERKEYLDNQYEDLTAALTTLENAIRKIDRETRTRFKETFDKVNTGFQENFPRLFGGGHAYLELTGDDLLDAGVTVMARPPGKRNSTIHLLSGGEKALTAVALVFSIFELNPAPFCMLDEVDAPLDDANVGRFCELVKDMSERVQFVFITHNKVTMELSDQLTGVTMNEPGVSRLVSVDVDRAVEMAAM